MKKLLTLLFVATLMITLLITPTYASIVPSPDAEDVPAPEVQ